MEKHDDLHQILAHLQALTSEPAGRPVGSAANQAAETYIADVLRRAGYEVEQQRFDCVDWRLDNVELWMGDGPLPARANPYSPACDVTSPIVAAANLIELRGANLTGKIALLHGELTSSSLFPKNYPFFTVEEHQEIIRLLESGAPRAVIMVSAHDEGPSPLIEDGDFVLPSITVPAKVGAVLIDTTKPVTVRVRSRSQPGIGANVIGRRSRPARDKLLICAHFDTKPGTPGALDNAAGVAAMLALADRLAAVDLPTNLEIVAFNGEDHFAAPGEVTYINRCDGEFGRIALVINIDGVGLKGQPVTIAFFNTDEAWAAKVRATVNTWPRLEETDPWPQGDHSIFAMQGIACVAITSGEIHALVENTLHTSRDSVNLVEPEQISNAIDFLAHLVQKIGIPRQQ